MSTRSLRRTFVVLALTGLVAGCTGPDEPKLADAPKYTPPAEPEKEVSKGKPAGYGNNPRYKAYMDEMDKKHGQGSN